MKTQLKQKKAEDQMTDDHIDLGLSQESSQVEEKLPDGTYILPAGVIRYLHIDTYSGGMIIREEADVKTEDKIFDYSCTAYRVQDAQIQGSSEMVDALCGTQNKVLARTGTRYYMKTNAAIKVKVNTLYQKNGIPQKQKILIKRGCG